jgi:hypothetical protein
MRKLSSLAEVAREAHYLSEIDEYNRLATCAICGPNIRVRKRKDGWRCVPHATALEYGVIGGEIPKVEGFCVICKTNPATVRDHCHENNMWRDALCDLCNKGLGFFRDDVEILTSAIKYVNEHKKRAE